MDKIIDKTNEATFVFDDIYDLKAFLWYKTRKHNDYFAQPFINLIRLWKEDTFATDADFIYVNLDVANKWGSFKTYGVYLHEVMHITLKHKHRFNKIKSEKPKQIGNLVIDEHKIYNIATDIVINEKLRKARRPLPDAVCFREDFNVPDEAQSSGAVYKVLLDRYENEFEKYKDMFEKFGKQAEEEEEANKKASSYGESNEGQENNQQEQNGGEPGDQSEQGDQDKQRNKGNLNGQGRESDEVIDDVKDPDKGSSDKGKKTDKDNPNDSKDKGKESNEPANASSDNKNNKKTDEEGKDSKQNNANKSGYKEGKLGKAVEESEKLQKGYNKKPLFPYEGEELDPVEQPSPVVNWLTFIIHKVGRATMDIKNSTYSRMDRRSGGTDWGYIRKGYTRTIPCPKVAFYVDVSGSMNDLPIQIFGDINKSLDKLRRIKADFYSFDNEVYETNPERPYISQGGTTINNVIKHINSNSYDLIIMVTDCDDVFNIADCKTKTIIVTDNQAIKAINPHEIYNVDFAKF